MEDSLLYRIALTLIPGVGDILGKKLISICGSPEAVFRDPGRIMKKRSRVGELLVHAIRDKGIIQRAGEEVRFIERYRIRPLYYQDQDYPGRLKHCNDGPVMLYYKGDADLNQSRIVGIVGTRSATAYGKAVTQELIRDLTEQGLLVVSGLAFGIDASAHRGALDAGLQTIGVLGHGLDRIYPFTHKSLAERIISQGGLLTEFMSGVKPSRENFPRRNRIIAGLCDAIVVVEAARKGGALITAELANSYNRDVFAIPGRVHDPYSEGANHLIRTNKAALIQGAADLVYLMGWKRDTGESNTVQKKIFLELSREEEIIVKLLQEKGQVGIDDLCTGSGLQQNQVSSALLNLEFEGVLKCLPGKVYTLL